MDTDFQTIINQINEINEEIADEKMIIENAKIIISHAKHDFEKNVLSKDEYDSFLITLNNDIKESKSKLMRYYCESLNLRITKKNYEIANLNKFQTDCLNTLIT